MRILMLSMFYEYRHGGAEVIVRKLRDLLAVRGYDIEMLCLNGGPEPQSGKVWRVPIPQFLKTHDQFTKRLMLFFHNNWFDRLWLRSALKLDIPFHQYDLIHCQESVS